MQYHIQDISSKEQGVFWINQFIWDPSNPLFFLFKDQPLSLCFHIENSLQMKRCQKGFLLPKQILLHLYINVGLSRIRKKSTLNCWFIARDGLEPRVHYLMDFFHYNTLSESYQYLSNLFLSKGRLLDQMTKALLRKRWLFPDEMKIGFM